jgi:AcrR family transcriptional regulator
MSAVTKGLPAPGPRSRRPRGEPTAAHLNRLQQIKEVATKFFYVQGYAATDLRQIADAAELHVSSLYTYISGKEQLLYEIMSEGMVEITAGLDEALSGTDDPAGQLRAALRAHILHHAHRQYRAWTSHVELRSLTGEYLDEILAMRRAYERRWIEVLTRGMAAGQFRESDPRLTMYGLLAAGQSVSRWYEPGGRMSAEEIAGTLTDSALSGLLAR